MASHLNDLASNVTLQKILQLIPANVFALFTATVTYVTPSGTCDATQRIVVWALFAVVTFVTAYMAIHNRHIPTGTVRTTFLCLFPEHECFCNMSHSMHLLSRDTVACRRRHSQRIQGVSPWTLYEA